MDTMFSQMKKLYDNELYDQVPPIAVMIEASYDRDRTLLIPEQYYLLHYYNADSHLRQKQYRKAEQIFRAALVGRKMIVKSKNTMSINFENIVEQYPEHLLRWRLALCLEAINEPGEALSVLNHVPHRQRNLKMNMFIGRLSLHLGRVQHAEIAFSTVLRDCPMNLDAMKGLLTLGVSETEISNLIAENSSLPLQIKELIDTYLEVNVAISKCQFAQAITMLDTLRSQSIFGSNELFTVMIAQCYYYNGEHDIALTHLQRAQANNFFILDGLSILGAILAENNDSVELERLTQLFMNPSEYASEHWLLFGYHYYVLKKFDKASYFAHKACYLNPRNVEACILKARVFLEMKKTDEALIQLRLLAQFANYRFEVYEGLVHAYINQHRWREAQLQAIEACRILGKSPRIYVLGASTYMAGQTKQARAKAKPFLVKALKMNKNHQQAILYMVKLLVEEGNTGKAIQLLRRLAEVRPSPEILTKIGDIYAERQERKEAIEFYTEAIHLDPLNRRAISQLEALEKQRNDDGAGASTSGVNVNDSFDDNSDMMDVQTDATDAGGEERLPSIGEETETLTLWSDTEPEVLQPYQE